MKLQLDTTAKTIKVEESVKLSKLIETLKKLLPSNEWKDFTLETNTTISYWTNPIIIREYPTYPIIIREYPTYPKWTNYPWYYSTSGVGNVGNAEFKSANNHLELNAGQYNVEV